MSNLNQKSGMFHKQPLKIIIEPVLKSNNFKLSVAFISRDGFWSSRFFEFNNYPGLAEVDYVIKKGYTHEITGAMNRFETLPGQFEKTF